MYGKNMLVIRYNFQQATDLTSSALTFLNFMPAFWLFASTDDGIDRELCSLSCVSLSDHEGAVVSRSKTKSVACLSYTR